MRCVAITKIVIGVTGMPGAGKGIVVEIAEEMHYGVVVMGDIVREETKLRGLELSPENVGRVTVELRREGGPAIVARRCIPKIQRTRRDIVVIDGIRSLFEVDELKNHFHLFKLLAIHSSPETRFKRLFKRRRSDDPSTWKIFSERDRRELEVGLGNVIASADYMIVNEEMKKDLESEIRRFLKNVTKHGRSRDSS